MLNLQLVKVVKIKCFKLSNTNGQKKRYTSIKLRLSFMMTHKVLVTGGVTDQVSQLYHK